MDKPPGAVYGAGTGACGISASGTGRDSRNEEAV
jgi:hypothetical protein